ncbi:MAG: hypothetical protein JSV00_05495 [bacterium]|nr:MAG: hypothetical protein JSV00_05495 [bacterium]
MHQPCYRNSFDGTSVMPLTFLHATKDYYDMLRLARGRDGIRTTFNLVPSLMDQIAGSADHESDVFLKILMKPVEDLDEDEIALLFDFLFIGSVRHQILPLRRYYQLYDRWERHGALAGAASLFSVQEILDIQVLFLLAWTGTVIRQEEPMIRALLRKGQQFKQQEKEDLVHLLLARVKEIIPAYRQAQEAGDIEITTTPYYDPILPLLRDFSSARAVEKDLPLPVFCRGLQEDAPVHVEKALAMYRDTFGIQCRGMWPSEGAVSEGTLALMASHGVLYAGSDEQVLFHSLHAANPVKGDRRMDLYRPWKLGTPGGEISIFFRDRGLSDLIGFTYQRMDAAEAVKHFLARVHDIRKALKTEEGIVSVILDGENAWEHYPGNAREFLDRFYDAVAGDEAIEMVTMSQALESAQALPLESVVPGSWIGGRLSTWVGHQEKNRAWEMVCRARSNLGPFLADEGKKNRPKVLEQLLIAEGSDWYWWFGDDHFTTLADRFDELFRLHLINAYRYAELEVPAELLEPIKRKRVRGHIETPKDRIQPDFYGRVSHYFEWLSAGRFDLDFDQGAMHKSDPVLRELRYGFDSENLYLRLDTEGDFLRRAEDMRLVIEAVAPLKRSFTFRITAGNMEIMEPADLEAGLLGAAGRVAEVRVPLKILEAGPGREILLSFSLWKGPDPIEKAPLFSLVKITVPEDYDLEYWIV